MLKSTATASRHSLTLAAMALLINQLTTTSASAQIAFEDVSIPAGFADAAAETWGAAWGDIDGDSYPDIFVNNHRTRAKLYRNNRDGTFTDVSQAVDVSRTGGWTGGRADVDKHGNAWGDVDNDGDDDLLFTVSESADRLLINDGGLLTDRTTQYGLDQLHHTQTRQNLFLDYNGDGRLDLASVALVSAAFSPQLSNGTFAHGTGGEVPMACATDGQWAHLMDLRPATGLEVLCAPRTGAYPKVNSFSNGVVGKTAGSLQYKAVNDAVTLDYNRDLRPDLFIIRRAERPSGAYQFSSQQFEAQLVTGAYKTNTITFKSTGVLTLKASLRAGSDPEGDPAYIDIGSIKWSPPSLTVQLDPKDARNSGIGAGSPGINVGYLADTGTWQITQSTDQYDYSYVQVSSTEPITGLTFSGLNASDTGYPGLLVRNTADGLVDASAKAGFTSVLPCQSAAAGDFDNDMDEDLFLVCTAGARNVPDRLYMNNGNGTFSKVANSAGASGPVGAAVAAQAGTGDSVVVADYDRDGFLDLFVTNGLNMRPVYIGGPQQLFHNLGNANRWIEFDLIGTTSNRDGIGAKVYVRAGGVTQYREQNGGYHRWSQNFKRLHVGLGSNLTADVRVDWPNGTTTRYAALASNRLYQLKQDGTVTKVSRKLP